MEPKPQSPPAAKLSPADLAALEEAYSAAVGKEQENRDFAFANVGSEICGIPVCLITLWQALVLISLGSPFVCGGIGGRIEVAQFLWILSPDFDPKAEKTPYRRRRFFPKPPTPWQRLVLQIAAIPLDELNDGIRDYMQATLMDSPASEDDGESGEGSKAPFTSFVASYIDVFAFEYGWKSKTIVHSPLQQLYQLIREIEKRRDPKFPLFNRLSDRVVDTADELRAKASNGASSSPLNPESRNLNPSEI